MSKYRTIATPHPFSNSHPEVAALASAPKSAYQYGKTSVQLACEQHPGLKHLHDGTTPERMPSSQWELEEDEEEYLRVNQRVQDAINDPTGRLKLFCENSNTRRIPEDVARIETLRELYMSKCRKVKELPLTLTRLCGTLQILDASYCDIQSVGEELAGLHSLKKLNLSHNKLKGFFWNPDHLTKLRFLNLSNNRIRFFGYRNRGLFEQLLEIEKEAVQNQLNAQRTLNLDHNDFIEPLSYPPSQWSLSEFPRHSPLSEYLPPQVDRCCVCQERVEIGSPLVYVKFQYFIGAKLAKALGKTSTPAVDGSQPVTTSRSGEKAAADNHLIGGTAATPLSKLSGEEEGEGENPVEEGQILATTTDDDDRQEDGPSSLEILLKQQRGGDFQHGINLDNLLLTRGASVSGEDMAPPCRIPFFFPHCTSSVCLAELHRLISAENFRIPRRL